MVGCGPRKAAITRLSKDCLLLEEASTLMLDSEAILLPVLWVGCCPSSSCCGYGSCVPGGRGRSNDIGSTAAGENDIVVGSSTVSSLSEGNALSSGSPSWLMDSRCELRSSVQANITPNANKTKPRKVSQTTFSTFPFVRAARKQCKPDKIYTREV